MIREFQILDTEQVMKLWFWGNVDAHPFVSEEYWHSHFNEIRYNKLRKLKIAEKVDTACRSLVE